MTPPRPTTARLINHHNYGAFVADAVRSALNQSVAFDEILVVDDGSSPEHLAQVREACATDPRVKLIEKENGGQLSCFNTGFEASTAEILFFLDADDFWDPGYLEAVLEVYRRRSDVSCVLASHRERHADGRVRERRSADRDLGYSIVRCHRFPRWVGAPTSCLSARREVLARFLPFGAGSGWRTCADECLVYGTSLAGARKFALGEVFVNYRIHGGNAWHGRRAGVSGLLMRRLEGLRLVESMRIRCSIPSELACLAPLEFRTVESPTWRDFREYAAVILDARLGFHTKIGLLFSLSLTHWFGRKRERKA